MASYSSHFDMVGDLLQAPAPWLKTGTSGAGVDYSIAHFYLRVGSDTFEMKVWKGTAALVENLTALAKSPNAFLVSGRCGGRPYGDPVIYPTELYASVMRPLQDSIVVASTDGELVIEELATV